MNAKDSMKKMDVLWEIAVEQKDVMSALNVFDVMMTISAAEANKGEKK